MGHWANTGFRTVVFKNIESVFRNPQTSMLEL